MKGRICSWLVALLLQYAALLAVDLRVSILAEGQQWHVDIQDLDQSIDSATIHYQVPGAVQAPFGLRYKDLPFQQAQFHVSIATGGADCSSDTEVLSSVAEPFTLCLEHGSDTCLSVKVVDSKLLLHSRYPCTVFLMESDTALENHGSDKMLVVPLDGSLHSYEKLIDTAHDLGWDFDDELGGIWEQFALPKVHPSYEFFKVVSASSYFLESKEALEAAGFRAYVPKRLWVAARHVDAPGWIIKGDVGEACIQERTWNRLLLSASMRRVISDFNMQRVAVPEKYVFAHSPTLANAPTADSAMYIVENCLSVVGAPNSLDLFRSESAWTQELVRELFILFSLTGLRDIGSHNMQFDSRGRLCFFDLELVNPKINEFRKYFLSYAPKVWRRYWRTLARDPSLAAEINDYRNHSFLSN